MVLGNSVGDRAAKRRDLRQVLVAGGNHDGAGQEVTPAGRQDEPVAGGCQPGHRHPFAHRAVGGELLQPLDDFHPGGIAVACLLAEQLVHPPRGVEPEGFPPLGAPALTDPAPLQDHMLDPAGAEGGAGGQPGRSSAHHRTVDQHLALPPSPPPPRRTSSARAHHPPRHALHRQEQALSGGWRALHQRSPSAACSAARNASGWSAAEKWPASSMTCKGQS